MKTESELQAENTFTTYAISTEISINVRSVDVIHPRFSVPSSRSMPN
ncbi:hypothetical protein [Baaleninema simplex]|nr:hypothetical protein [Baaleninema simplex]